MTKYKMNKNINATTIKNGQTFQYRVLAQKEQMLTFRHILFTSSTTIDSRQSTEQIDNNIL